MADLSLPDPSSRLRSAPSIPSKFETVLHFGNQEKDAFWSRTTRFQEHANPLPGPGTYVQSGTLEKVTTSIGKKGFGSGFVSKSRRFSGDPIFRSPGPGSYSASSFTTTILKPVSKLKCTSNFAPRLNTHQKKEPESEIGPGHYNIDSPVEKKHQPKLNATFRSGTNRFESAMQDKANSLPAPGQYEVENVLVNLEVSRAKAPVSVFKSKTGRKFDRDKDRASQLDVISSFKPPLHIAPSLGIDLPRSPPKVTVEVKPGPGQYDLPPAAIVEKDIHRQSSMFTNAIDRFGMPIVHSKVSIPVPGPGSYQTVETEKQRSLISSSYFMSGTERGDKPFNPHVARPGPAYYTPEAPNKKSFHLNIARRWV